MQRQQMRKRPRVRDRRWHRLRASQATAGEPKGKAMRNTGSTAKLRESGRSGRRRRPLRAAGVVAAVALALTVAAPAWATESSATATLAPIGTGSYLLTVTNTGSGTLTEFEVLPGEVPIPPTNIVPSPSCETYSGFIKCRITVVPGASTQMCYTGHAPTEGLPGIWMLLRGESELGEGQTISESGHTSLVVSPAVPSCPLPGFNRGPGPGANTETGSTPKSGRGPAETRCIVPNLKGKNLHAAEKALVLAHCAAGKVKRASSKHVKKGSVMSQSPGAGKSLPKRTKVSLVVSKGK
jgi:hypothetical protein